MRKIILIILFCFVSMSFSHTTIQETSIPSIELRDTTFLKSDELNDSILYLALVYYGIKNPKTVLAQAKLESGNYTSYHCRVRNNFLGLYNSRKKEYFKFDHWTECIKGYKDMVEYKLRDGEDYYDFLLRIGYAEDPLYLDKIKRIEENLN